MKFTTSIVVILAAPAMALQGGYLSQMGAAQQPQQAAPVDYLSQMGGGSAMKPSSLKPSSPAGPAFGGSYLDNVGEYVAPAADQYYPPPAAAHGDYLSQMGGGSAMKPSSLKPAGAAGPAFGGTYLDNMAGYAAPAAEYAAPITAEAYQGDYLAQMGGGSEMKPSSLKQSGLAGPAFGGTYLDNIGGYVAPVTFSMSEMLDEHAAPVAAGEYLGSLNTAAAPAGSGPAGYLDTLRIQAAQSAATNLPGYLDTLSVQYSTVVGGLGPQTYLDNIAGAATVSAKVEAATEFTMVASEPILAAINQMNENMNRNQQATIEILQDISSSMQQLVDTTQAYAAVRESEQQQQYAAPVEEAAPAAANYLNHLNGASSGAPTGSGLSGYLDLLPNTELTFALAAGATAAPTVPAWN